MGIEKEQSSGSRRGQGEEYRILMLALNSEKADDRLEDGTIRLYIGLVDFHSVDLNQNKFTQCCFPSLIMVEFTDAMMSLNDKFLYMVGGVTPPIARSPDFQQLQLGSPLSNRTHYFGGSSLDMSNEAAVWCPAPVFIVDPINFNYVSFYGSKCGGIHARFKDKDNNLDMNVERRHFDAMLHLGNNILCFAGWTPIYPTPAVSTLEIVFFKFEALVTSETVIIKACESYSYDLPKAKDVLRFLSI